MDPLDLVFDRDNDHPDVQRAWAERATASVAARLGLNPEAAAALIRDVPPEAVELALARRDIEAIAVLRRQTGASLRTATDALRRLKVLLRLG